MTEKHRWMADRERLAAVRRERDELINYIIVLERELEEIRADRHYVLGAVEHNHELRGDDGDFQRVTDIREADGTLWRNTFKTRGRSGPGQLVEWITERLPSRSSPNHPTLAHRRR
jgi:hypothetical protein